MAAAALTAVAAVTLLANIGGTQTRSMGLLKFLVSKSFSLDGHQFTVSSLYSFNSLTAMGARECPLLN
jgi:hypothetical protein